jgi:hypothetical protein
LGKVHLSILGDARFIHALIYGMRSHSAHSESFSACIICITCAMFRYAASGEEVKWYKESRRLTFSAACRAAVGDILTDSDLDEMFPLADVFGQAAFAPVCVFSFLHYALFLFVKHIFVFLTFSSVFLFCIKDIMLPLLYSWIIILHYPSCAYYSSTLGSVVCSCCCTSIQYWFHNSFASSTWNLGCSGLSVAAIQRNSRHSY